MKKVLFALILTASFMTACNPGPGKVQVDSVDSTEASVDTVVADSLTQDTL